MDNNSQILSENKKSRYLLFKIASEIENDNLYWKNRN